MPLSGSGRTLVLRTRVFHKRKLRVAVSAVLQTRDKKTVLIVAGEASADDHGSKLVRSVRRLDPGVSFMGIGGNRMADAGVEILVSSSEMAVVGLTEVFSRLRRITGAYVRLKNILRYRSPDLLILIDYPEFNLRLAHIARLNRVPVLYYISPQIWAWRRGRIKKIVRRVDRMAVILPFEELFYRQRGVRVDYVGHPLMDDPPRSLKREEAAGAVGIHTGSPVLALLPGSRTEEIRNLLPPMLKAAELLLRRLPDLQCVLPVASTVSFDLVRSMLRDCRAPVIALEGNVPAALSASHLALVTSGTATLETAVMGVPMIILYRLSPLTYQVAKRVVRVPYIGLVNLVAGEGVVPELIQGDVSPSAIADEALLLLENGQRRKNMIENLKKVRQRLGEGGASRKTARIVLEMLYGKEK